MTLRQRLSASSDFLRQVDEEIQARVEKLVSLGELAEDQGRRLAQRLIALGAAVRAEQELQEAALQRALEARGVPTRDDLAKLSEMLDRLSAEVDSLKK